MVKTLPLKPEQICSIRVRLEMQNNFPDLALFQLGQPASWSGGRSLKMRGSNAEQEGRQER